jgi:hypothetical protein
VGGDLHLNPVKGLPEQGKQLLGLNREHVSSKKKWGDIAAAPVLIVTQSCLELRRCEENSTKDEIGKNQGQDDVTRLGDDISKGRLSAPKARQVGKPRFKTDARKGQSKPYRP